MADPLDTIARICAEQPHDALAQIADALGYTEQREQERAQREQSLAGLVKRLARRLHPEDNLRVTATDYLKEQGFFNPLRTSGVRVCDKPDHCWAIQRCEDVGSGKAARKCDTVPVPAGVAACRAKQTGPKEWVCDCEQVQPGCKPSMAGAAVVDFPPGDARSVAGTPAAEPDTGGMTIAKALRQGLKAEPWLARGTGPEACVGICAIQLQGWWHTAESAKQWADGYNRAIEHMRSAYGVKGLRHETVSPADADGSAAR